MYMKKTTHISLSSNNLFNTKNQYIFFRFIHSDLVKYKKITSKVWFMHFIYRYHTSNTHAVIYRAYRIMILETESFSLMITYVNQESVKRQH